MQILTGADGNIKTVTNTTTTTTNTTTFRVTMQKGNFQLSDLEASARNEMCRTVCEVGLSDFMNGWASTSMKRRAARHAVTAKPKTGPRCPHCSRVCASEFGLRSHLRIHTAHRFSNSKQCNVVVDLDGLQQQQQQQLLL